MTITLYGLKNCDTCKKAIKALEAADRTVRFVDIREGADLAAKAPEWIAAVGADALVNRRSTTWRALSDADRAAAERGEPAVLVAQPTLIKRPVIEAEGAVTVGWTKEIEAKLL